MIAIRPPSASSRSCLPVSASPASSQTCRDLPWPSRAAAPRCPKRRMAASSTCLARDCPARHPAADISGDRRDDGFRRGDRQPEADRSGSWGAARNFAALLLASSLGFTIQEAGAIGILGAADGPIALFVTANSHRTFLGPVPVVAYASTALMFIMQPRAMRLLTAGPERHRAVTKLQKIAFPIVITLIFSVFFRRSRH